MALPAHLLGQLPAGVTQGSTLPETVAGNASARADALPIGFLGLDAYLPDRGLLRGSVVEMAVAAPTSLATSIALAACRAAQQAGQQQGHDETWCAFVDPSSTLYAPGVAAAGVDLARLLVVRPTPESLARTALRLVRARAFAVVVIDLVGVPGVIWDPAGATSGGLGGWRRRGVALGTWPRIVRQLALAIEATATSVLLLTDSEARRPIPLPVAMRIELGRVGEQRLSLRIAKEQRGRISPPRSLTWTRPRLALARLASKGARRRELVSSPG